MAFVRANYGVADSRIDWDEISLAFLDRTRGPRQRAIPDLDNPKNPRQRSPYCSQSRACSAPIESGGFSWDQRWESLSALIRFWEAEDPYVPALPKTRAHPGLAGRRSVSIESGIRRILQRGPYRTDHSAIDWQSLVDAAQLVVDTQTGRRECRSRARTRPSWRDNTSAAQTADFS
jgi:hypothetical protein